MTDYMQSYSFLSASMRVVFGLTLFAFLLIACTTSESEDTLRKDSTLTLQEMPIGIGRGFASASLDDRVQPVEVSEGAEAPNFYLTLDDGRFVSLRDFVGKPVLINFWASWCGPCRLEMPEIVNVANNHPELIVLAVNVQESMTEIQPFAESFDMQMPIIRDAEGKLRDRYDVRGMPTTFFLDREGKIFTIWAGMLSASLLDEILADLGV